MGAQAHADDTQYVDDLLDEYPVPANRLLAEQDLRYGQMAVVIHQGEDWPSGIFCRNCHARWPCSLYRWGLRVLVVAEWTVADIQFLVTRAKAGDVPWT